MVVLGLMGRVVVRVWSVREVRSVFGCVVGLGGVVGDEGAYECFCVEVAGFVECVVEEVGLFVAFVIDVVVG